MQTMTDARVRQERAIQNLERQLDDILPALDGEYDRGVLATVDAATFRRGYVGKAVQFAHEAISDLREALAPND